MAGNGDYAVECTRAQRLFSNVSAASNQNPHQFGIPHDDCSSLDVQRKEGFRTNGVLNSTDRNKEDDELKRQETWIDKNLVVDKTSGTYRNTEYGFLIHSDVDTVESTACNTQYTHIAGIVTQNGTSAISTNIVTDTTQGTVKSIAQYVRKFSTQDTASVKSTSDPKDKSHVDIHTPGTADRVDSIAKYVRSCSPHNKGDKHLPPINSPKNHANCDIETQIKTVDNLTCTNTRERTGKEPVPNHPLGFKRLRDSKQRDFALLDKNKDSKQICFKLKSDIVQKQSFNSSQVKSKPKCSCATNTKTAYSLGKATTLPTTGCSYTKFRLHLQPRVTAENAACVQPAIVETLPKDNRKCGIKPADKSQIDANTEDNKHIGVTAKDTKKNGVILRHCDHSKSNQRPQSLVFRKISSPLFRKSHSLDSLEKTLLKKSIKKRRSFIHSSPSKSGVLTSTESCNSIYFSTLSLASSKTCDSYHTASSGSIYYDLDTCDSETSSDWIKVGQGQKCEWNDTCSSSSLESFQSASSNLSFPVRFQESSIFPCYNCGCLRNSDSRNLSYLQGQGDTQLEVTPDPFIDRSESYLTAIQNSATSREQEICDTVVVTNETKPTDSLFQRVCKSPLLNRVKTKLQSATSPKSVRKNNSEKSQGEQNQILHGGRVLLNIQNKQPHQQLAVFANVSKVTGCNNAHIKCPVNTNLTVSNALLGSRKQTITNIDSVSLSNQEAINQQETPQSLIGDVIDDKVTANDVTDNCVTKNDVKCDSSLKEKSCDTSGISGLEDSQKRLKRLQRDFHSLPLDRKDRTDATCKTKILESKPLFNSLKRFHLRRLNFTKYLPTENQTEICDRTASRGENHLSETDTCDLSDETEIETSRDTHNATGCFGELFPKRSNSEQIEKTEKSILLEKPRGDSLPQESRCDNLCGKTCLFSFYSACKCCELRNLGVNFHAANANETSLGSGTNLNNNNFCLSQHCQIAQKGHLIPTYGFHPQLSPKNYQKSTESQHTLENNNLHCVQHNEDSNLNTTHTNADVDNNVTSILPCTHNNDNCVRHNTNHAVTNVTNVSGHINTATPSDIENSNGLIPDVANSCDPDEVKSRQVESNSAKSDTLISDTKNNPDTVRQEPSWIQSAQGKRHTFRSAKARLQGLLYRKCHVTEDSQSVGSSETRDSTRASSHATVASKKSAASSGQSSGRGFDHSHQTYQLQHDNGEWVDVHGTLTAFYDPGVEQASDEELLAVIEAEQALIEMEQDIEDAPHPSPEVTSHSTKPASMSRTKMAAKKLPFIDIAKSASTSLVPTQSFDAATLATGVAKEKMALKSFKHSKSLGAVENLLLPEDTERRSRKRSHDNDINRQESVQKWLLSLAEPSKDALDIDMEDQAEISQSDCSNRKPDQNANFEDDLFLGAEAKLLGTAEKETGEIETTSAEEKEPNKDSDKDSQTSQAAQHSDSQPTNRSESISQTVNLTPSLTTPQPAWQRRLQLIKTDSLQSSDSHKSYNSLEDILRERHCDPETILTNLGFGSLDTDCLKAKRIPKRFLSEPSQARGISVSDFLRANPQVERSLLELQESFGVPGYGGGSLLLGSLATVARDTNEEDIESDIDGDKGDVKLEETAHASSCVESPQAPPTTANFVPASGKFVPPSVKFSPAPGSFTTPVRQGNAFATAARNVILFNRFTNIMDSSNLTDTPQASVHEGVTPHGQTFTSILHPDNSQYIASQGLYDINKNNQSTEANQSNGAITKSALNTKTGKSPSPRLSPNPYILENNNHLKVNSPQSESQRRTLILASPIPEDWNLPHPSSSTTKLDTVHHQDTVNEIEITVHKSKSSQLLKVPEDNPAKVQKEETRSDIESSSQNTLQTGTSRSDLLNSPAPPARTVSPNFINWDTLSSKETPPNPLFDSTCLSMEVQVNGESPMKDKHYGKPKSNGFSTPGDYSRDKHHHSQDVPRSLDLDADFDANGDSFMLISGANQSHKPKLSEMLGMSSLYNTHNEHTAFQGGDNYHQNGYDVTNVNKDFNKSKFASDNLLSVIPTRDSDSKSSNNSFDLNAMEQDACMSDIIPDKSLFGILKSQKDAQDTMNNAPSRQFSLPSERFSNGFSLFSDESKTSDSILKKRNGHFSNHGGENGTSFTEPSMTSSNAKRDLPFSLPKFSILDDDINISEPSNPYSNSIDTTLSKSERARNVFANETKKKSVRPLSYLDRIPTERARSRSTENLSLWEGIDGDQFPAHKRRLERMRKSSWSRSRQFQDSVDLPTSDYESPFTTNLSSSSRAGRGGASNSSGGIGHQFSSLNSYKSMENLGSTLFDTGFSSSNLSNGDDNTSYLSRLQRLKDDHTSKYQARMENLHVMSSQPQSLPPERPYSPLSYQDGYSPSSSDAEGYMYKLRQLKQEHEQSSAQTREPNGNARTRMNSESSTQSSSSSSYLDKMQQIKQQHELRKHEEMQRVQGPLVINDNHDAALFPADHSEAMPPSPSYQDVMTNPHNYDVIHQYGDDTARTSDDIGSYGVTASYDIITNDHDVNFADHDVMTPSRDIANPSNDAMLVSDDVIAPSSDVIVQVHDVDAQNDANLNIDNDDVTNSDDVINNFDVTKQENGGSSQPRHTMLTQLKEKPVMQSFEMEEIQSGDADIVSEDLPNIKHKQGPLLRASSTQSDSSGFADSTDSNCNSEALSTTKQNTVESLHTSVDTLESYSRQDSESSIGTLTEPGLHGHSADSSLNNSAKSLDNETLSVKSEDTVISNTKPEIPSLKPTEKEKIVSDIVQKEELQNESVKGAKHELLSKENEKFTEKREQLSEKQGSVPPIVRETQGRVVKKGLIPDERLETVSTDNSLSQSEKIYEFTSQSSVTSAENLPTKLLPDAQTVSSQDSSPVSKTKSVPNDANKSSSNEKDITLSTVKHNVSDNTLYLETSESHDGVTMETKTFAAEIVNDAIEHAKHQLEDKSTDAHLNSKNLVDMESNNIRSDVENTDDDYYHGNEDGYHEDSPQFEEYRFSYPQARDEGIDVENPEAFASSEEILVENDNIREQVTDSSHDGNSKFADIDQYPVPEFPKVRLANRRKEIKKQSKVKGSLDNGESFEMVEAEQDMLEQLKDLEDFAEEKPARKASDLHVIYDIRESSLEREYSPTPDLNSNPPTDLEQIAEENGSVHKDLENESESGESSSESESSDDKEEVIEDELISQQNKAREEERMRKELKWMASLSQDVEGETKTQEPSAFKKVKNKIKSTFGSKPRASSKYAEKRRSLDEGRLETLSKGFQDNAEMMFRATLTPFSRTWSQEEMQGHSTEDLALPVDKNTSRTFQSVKPNRKSFAEEMNELEELSENDAEFAPKQNGYKDNPSDNSRPERYFENPSCDFTSASSADEDVHLQGLSYHGDLPAESHHSITNHGGGNFDDLIEELDWDQPDAESSRADLNQFLLDPLEMQIEARRRSMQQNQDGRLFSAEQVENKEADETMSTMKSELDQSISVSDNTRSLDKSFEEKCVGTDDENSVFSPASVSANSDNYKYSTRIIVSKFSTDPNPQPVQVNHVSEVTLVIDDGKIQEIQNADALDESGGVIPGKYESYEIPADQLHSHPSHSYSVDNLHSAYGHNHPGYYPYAYDPYGFYTPYGYPPPMPPNKLMKGAPFRHPMYRDSGYNTAFTSLSDPFGGVRAKSVSCLDLKFNQSHEGSSYTRVDQSDRGAAGSRSMDDLDRDEGDLQYSDSRMGERSMASGYDMSSSMYTHSSNVSEHQLLCTMLKQSHYFDPQLDGILNKSQWPLFARTRAITTQNLVEEVKLMQHALQKYKLEFRALEIRSRGAYKAHQDQLNTEEREALESMEELRSEIANEMAHLEKALANRMRRIIAGSRSPIHDVTNVDLAGLNVIGQMIEVLKEQVYHSNTVTSLVDPDASMPSHPLLTELETTSEEHEANISMMNRSSSLIDHLTLLQQEYKSSQQSHANNILSINNSLREQAVLLDEIRNSLLTETQHLKFKVQDTESQLSELRQQLNLSSSTSDTSPQPQARTVDLVLSDTDLDQSTET